MSARSLPQDLQNAVETLLAGNNGGLREGTAQLRATYERAASSADVSVAAYVAARLPATYASISRVFELVREVAPDFSPRSLLDIGAGPGTASWVAAEAWADLVQITMIERDSRFADLAQNLAAASQTHALKSSRIERVDLGQLSGQAELVVAGYVFAEQKLDRAGDVALRLWEACTDMLVIVEPGTPEGFARIRAARSALLEAGANPVAPCPHAGDCPMTGADWCHFKTRLQRSKSHMLAKGASVPFEDESFSFVVVSRKERLLAEARLIAPPVTNKVATTLKLCAQGGVEQRVIASRDKAAYKLSKKKIWGDSWG